MSDEIKCRTMTTIEFARNMGSEMSKIEAGGDHVALTRLGKISVVVVSIEFYNRSVGALTDNLFGTNKI